MYLNNCFNISSHHDGAMLIKVVLPLVMMCHYQDLIGCQDFPFYSITTLSSVKYFDLFMSVARGEEGREMIGG